MTPSFSAVVMDLLKYQEVLTEDNIRDIYRISYVARARYQQKIDNYPSALKALAAVLKV